MKNFCFAISILAVFLSQNAWAGDGRQNYKILASVNDPVAQRVAQDVLKNGGLAGDAAVAAAWVMTVTRADMVSPGGGGYALFFDAATGKTQVLDFRVDLPLSVIKTYRDAKKRNVALEAGVPGFAPGLQVLQKRLGRKTWSDVLEPAAAIAEGLGQEENKAPILAQTLRLVQEQGAKALSTADVNKKIAATLRAAGGVLSADDLKTFDPVIKPASLFYFREERIYVSGFGDSSKNLISFLEAARSRGLPKDLSERPDFIRHVLAGKKPALAINGFAAAKIMVRDKEGNVVLLSLTNFGDGGVETGLGYRLNRALRADDGEELPDVPFDLISQTRRKPITFSLSVLLWREFKLTKALVTGEHLAADQQAFQMIWELSDSRSVGDVAGQKRVYLLPGQNVLASHGRGKITEKGLMPLVLESGVFDATLSDLGSGQSVVSAW